MANGGWRYLGGRKPKSAKDRIDLYTMPVTESGCLLWIGPCNPNGYGHIKIDKVKYLAHRLFWERENGKIPVGMFVCHKCDTPCCVNTNHLFLGTVQDNNADKLRKGRQFKGKRPDGFVNHLVGERNWNARLTEIDILSIRSDNRPQRKIAIDYGVSQALIHNVKSGKTWKHVTTIQQ